MPKVVLDTSSFVSAVLRPGSIPAAAWHLARERHVICLSDALAAEMREVLSRPKFRAYVEPAEIEAALRLLEGRAERVIPRETVTDCRDPKDNKVLELALAADAAAIVSSDADLTVLDPWRGIPVLVPGAFIARFG